MLEYAASIVNGLVMPDDLPDYTPHAFPKSPSPIILEDEGRRVVQMHRWGVGYTVKGKPTFVTNARDDQLLKIRLWKESVSLRRCLIPLVGYFEPGPGPVGARGEIIFTMRDRPVFFVAGLWDTDPDGTRAYAMVTTSPNAYVTPFHDRQPVALSDSDALAWLGAQPLPVDRVVALTRPPPDEVMHHEILPAVPRVKKGNDVRPEADTGQGTLFLS
jgi:putative SOS response-associated peptidase YedK